MNLKERSDFAEAAHRRYQEILEIAVDANATTGSGQSDVEDDGMFETHFDGPSWKEERDYFIDHCPIFKDSIDTNTPGFRYLRFDNIAWAQVFHDTITFGLAICHICKRTMAPGESHSIQAEFWMVGCDERVGEPEPLTWHKSDSEHRYCIKHTPEP